MAHSRLCSIPDCGKTADRKGWCSAHYKRWRRHGDPLAGRIFNGEAYAFLKVAAEYEGDDCLTWPYARVESGYGRINLNGRSRVASRVVCEMAHGRPPEPSYEAAHSCGNGRLGCVNRNHLSWKTLASNYADREDHGTIARGEQCSWAKLTEQDVRSIFMDERPYPAVAREYGVSYVTVCDIKRRKSWAWLDLR